VIEAKPQSWNQMIKKRTVITTEKHQVWVIRQDLAETLETQGEEDQGPGPLVSAESAGADQSTRDRSSGDSGQISDVDSIPDDN